jgi:O-antigen/teichoic acid export membrane protein
MTQRSESEEFHFIGIMELCLRYRMIRNFLRKTADNTLARNAGWLFAGQGLSFVTQAIYFVVLARLLGTVQYGILAAAFALVSIFSQYSAMGSGLLFLRYVSPDHSRFREYWGNILLSTATIGTLLVLVLLLSGRWLVGGPSASILVFIAIGECICGQLATCISQVFQTFEKMRITAIFGLLANLLRLFLAVGMIVVLHHATAREWSIASLTVSIVAAAAASVTVTLQFGLPKFIPRLLMERMGEGVIFAVSGSTTSVYNDIDKVILGHYGMSAANGIYSMAYRIVNICTMPIMSVYSAALPRFFREGVNGVRTTELFARRLLKRTSVIGILGGVVMFTTAPLIPHIIGRSFSASVVALRWLCLIPLFRSLHLCAGDAMSGAGYQKYRLASQFIAASSNFAMNLYLIPHYSWLGAAWASLITDGGLAAMNWAVLFWLKRNQATYIPIMDPA